MKKRGKNYYRKLYRAYPDVVTTTQLREMLGGVGDTFARKLIHEKRVKSIFIKHSYSTHSTLMAVTDFTFGTHFTFK